MITRTLTILTAGTLLAVPLVAVPPDGGDAAAAPGEAVAVQFGAGQVTFQPRVAGDAVSATLSCADGTYVQRELSGVVSLSLPLTAADGRPVADGRCKYEVRVHPAVDHEALRAAEEADDDATLERLSRLEQEQTVVVTGTFQVLGGTVVSADHSIDE